MSSNFLFLAEPFPVLEKMGSLAEVYLYTDVNACMYKMGSLAETIVNYIFDFENLKLPSGTENTHANRINFLKQNKMLSDDINNILYILRINRNEAVHAGYASFEDCVTLIEMAYTLSVWFMQIYGDNDYEPVPFEMPGDIREKADYPKLLDENIKLSAELEIAQAAAQKKPVRSNVQSSDHRQSADNANSIARLSEEATRYIIETLIDEEGNRIEQEKTVIRKSFRQFQLKTMGFVSIFIGPLVLFTTSVTYGLRFPQSISETATIANKSGAILPFCLGALALFALTYAIVYAYDKLDKIFTSCMAAGFTVVAMQMCSSRYIKWPRVGLLGVSPQVSNTLHSIGALIGFGAMILWIMLCFRKSDKRKEFQTKEKQKRNGIYFYFGIAMVLSLGIFVLKWVGLLGTSFPVVFVTEFAMLLIGGIACVIKGGFVLRDKE